jgi:hypothetical protein
LEADSPQVVSPPEAWPRPEVPARAAVLPAAASEVEPVERRVEEESSAAVALRALAPPVAAPRAEVMPRAAVAQGAEVTP